MSIPEAFDEILEDITCPKCGTQGMVPNGGFDYECPNPNCDYEGSLDEN